MQAVLSEKLNIYRLSKPDHTGGTDAAGNISKQKGSNEMDRGELVREAIRKAKEEEIRKKKDATVITEHENGVKTITTFYRKGNAVWCRMKTGCIESNSRVYKIGTNKPYIRDMGRYWYLGQEEIKAMNSVL